MILVIKDLYGNAKKEGKDLYRPFKGVMRKIDACYKRDFNGENDLNSPTIFVEVKSKKEADKALEAIIEFLDKNCKDYDFTSKIYK